MNTSSPWQRSVSLVLAAFTAVFAAGLIWFFLLFLIDQARSAAPFGGHTVPLGYEFILANRVAVMFIILCAAMLAHALARVVQCAVRWRLHT